MMEDRSKSKTNIPCCKFRSTDNMLVTIVSRLVKTTIGKNTSIFQDFSPCRISTKFLQEFILKFLLLFLQEFIQAHFNYLTDFGEILTT